PLGRALLIGPREPTLRVLRELDAVGRIGIHEVCRGERWGGEIAGHERPARERLTVCREVARVPDAFVLPERHVELARSVEPAEAVVTRAIGVKEEPGPFWHLIPT